MERYFTGTASRIEGIGLEVIAKETAMRHAHAFQPVTDADLELDVGGHYQYRVRGEFHMLNPLTVAKGAACSAEAKLCHIHRNTRGS